MGKYSGRLAQRYAKALLRSLQAETEKEQIGLTLQQVSGELLGFARIWSAQKELSSSIVNPMFPKEERGNALLTLARAAGMSELGQRFIRVVFERERAAALPEIASAFAALADEAASVVRVEVTVARNVSSDEARAIQLDLRHRIPGDPVFSWKVDPVILGGMIVRYGGKVLDGSLSGQLERLERKLLG